MNSSFSCDKEVLFSSELDINISEILYSISPEFFIKLCKFSSFCLSVTEMLFAIVNDIILFHSNWLLI